MVSVTFAFGSNEPEARHILTFLRENGLITEAQFT
jgi:hypothetical protein